MRKTVRPARDDPEGSVDLFDETRKNELGEMYCVQPAIMIEEVPYYWSRYEQRRLREMASEKGGKNE